MVYWWREKMEGEMKKCILFFTVFIMALTLVGCKSVTTTEEPLSSTLTMDESLFSIAESLNETEFGITNIILYLDEFVGDTYIIQFENGDLVEIRDDDNIKYHMSIESDYSSAEMVAYGHYGELDAASIQIVIAVGTTPSTGRVNDFDLTLERTSIDIAFDVYINSADISQTISTQLFNSNGLELLARARTLFETVLDVEFR